VAHRDRAAVLARQLVDRPQGGPLLAFGTRAFELAHRRDEDGDRVGRRQALDVVSDAEDDLDIAAARRADRDALLGGVCGRAGGAALGEDFARAVGGPCDGRRAVHGVGRREQVNDLASDQFGMTSVCEERGDVAQAVRDTRVTQSELRMVRRQVLAP
jgi:hypothetical protein